MNIDSLMKLSVSIIISLTAGFVGSFFTISSINSWYEMLNKPFFNPPNSIFGPVWTVLYILMGVSLYLVWIAKKSKYTSLAIKLFFTQLFLNALWSIIFFGWRDPLLAFIEIIILWILIFKTIKTFAKISENASYLLYPYIAWVTFAAFLNLSIVLLN